ncbi:TPA: DUF2384 domain-containing protein [Pseudomonas aeruginosa]|uniref:type II RES/Xre toxin-antitoxin system antitoxin n=1 Tax=Pseudomonas aeruginosa TaxID=287 RepID=UPI00141B1E01|nr:antitoxin Xre/MbcA/ParS toxin-binding domain-containing protein [Pseudomonas aeruginosa]MBR7823006.1 DUF2384 domain-containing protein [Pseudomonas aeruginosa]MBR7851240.1 DUF2384 domain-containing protein [Pseudomonas aeruginosa]MBR7863902.1 DUF2384 domain-containing protein [Pseudomonas aeruginosa]MBR7870679.1 DUF2384 domain-containing protein [Pseudomonas aeruginosa]MBW6202525.1 DUF2384 domain-containing protein [Pseudomonas aeruginosa]
MSELRTYQSEPAIASGDYWEQLGIPRHEADLIAEVRAGFAFITLERLAAISGFSESDLAEMVGLSRYALGQGRRRGRWSVQQSDRLLRVVRVLAAASELFGGDQVAAKRWLTLSQLGLGGERPIAMLATEIEANAVLHLIGRIEHGVVS